VTGKPITEDAVMKTYHLDPSMPVLQNCRRARESIQGPDCGQEAIAIAKEGVLRAEIESWGGA